MQLLFEAIEVSCFAWGTATSYCYKVHMLASTLMSVTIMTDCFVLSPFRNSFLAADFESMMVVASVFNDGLVTPLLANTKFGTSHEKLVQCVHDFTQWINRLAPQRPVEEVLYMPQLCKFGILGCFCVTTSTLHSLYVTCLFSHPF